MKDVLRPRHSDPLEQAVKGGLGHAVRLHQKPDKRV
jgi:hypothetical protein